MKTTATVCASCPAGQRGLAGRIAEVLAPYAVDVRTTECMSGCTRPSTIAFRAPGKVAYLFGEISEDDLADIVAFVRCYQLSPDGTFADAQVIGALRFKAIARIPA